MKRSKEEILKFIKKFEGHKYFYDIIESLIDESDDETKEIIFDCLYEDKEPTEPTYEDLEFAKCFEEENKLEEEILLYGNPH